MKKLLLVSLFIFMTGCSGFGTKDHAKAYMNYGFAADMVSTHTFMNKGCVEGNPVYGDASKEEIFMINLPLAWWLNGLIEDGELPPWAGYVIGSIRFGAAAHNFSLDC